MIDTSTLATSIPPKLEPFHRPERTLIVSGISRSGTSLFSVLINQIPNAVCFNETMTADPAEICEAAARMRRQLKNGKPVPNKFGDQGELTTNTLTGVYKQKQVVDRPLDHDMVVASKRNLPYLNSIFTLLSFGFKCCVLIRDPVYTLGSWSSPKAAEAEIPGALVGEDNLHRHWERVEFTRSDIIERRAEAWEHYAALLWRLRGRVKIYAYERICAETELVLADLALYLGLEPPETIPPIVRGLKNDDSRYPELDRIRAAVAELCPSRSKFGYA